MSEPEETASSSRKTSGNISRIALISAAILAVGAVGVQVYRGMEAGDSAGGTGTKVAASETEAAPSVDEVIAGLEKKLQDDPEDAESWRMLGWSYFETQKFAESATAMKRATTLDPKNPEYWSMLGEALVMSSNGQQVPDDAADAFKKALALDKSDPRARYFLAVQKDISGDHTGAINDWFALLEDTPADAPYAADIRRVIGQVAEKRKYRRCRAACQGYTRRTHWRDLNQLGLTLPLPRFPDPAASKCKKPPPCPLASRKR